jgi:hypothetical protein
MLDLKSLLSREAADERRRLRLIDLIRKRDNAPELHDAADNDWCQAEKEGKSSEFLWRSLVRVHTTKQGV